MPRLTVKIEQNDWVDEVQGEDTDWLDDRLEGEWEDDLPEGDWGE